MQRGAGACAPQTCPVQREVAGGAPQLCSAERASAHHICAARGVRLRTTDMEPMCSSLCSSCADLGRADDDPVAPARLSARRGQRRLLHADGHWLLRAQIQGTRQWAQARGRPGRSSAQWAPIPMVPQRRSDAGTKTDRLECGVGYGTNRKEEGDEDQGSRPRRERGTTG